MNINNNNVRKIKCVRNDSDVIDCNNMEHLLTIGGEYTVTNVDVHNWYTMIKLEEFPDMEFNSVLFEEVEE